MQRLAEEQGTGRTPVLMTVATTVVIFILLGGYRNTLTGYSYQTGLATRPLLLNTVMVASLLFCAGLVAKSGVRRFSAVLGNGWLLYVLPLLALLSSLWSTDPTVSIQRGMILFSVYFSATAIVAFHGATRSFELYFWAGLAVILGSVVTALLMPATGVHQWSDQVQFSHAGSWRGVLSHRTALGLFSAFFLVFVLACRRFLSRRQIVTACAGAILCLIMARSTGAFLALMVGFAFIVLTERIANRGYETILWLIAFGAISVILGWLSFRFVGDDIFALIGKSSDLTGRTDIWTRALRVTTHNRLLGLGYQTAIAEVIDRGAFRFYDTIAVNAQGAYVDILLSFGILGAVVLAVSVLAMVGRILADISIPHAGWENSGDPRITISRLAAAFVFMIFEASIVESYYMESNNFLTASLAVIGSAALSISRAAPTRPVA